MLAALRSTRAKLPRPSTLSQQRRHLSIHEYLSMNLLNQYGVPTPKSKPAFSADEAFQVAKNFGAEKLVIKAQVLAGGRGKGHFDGKDGLKGGVQMVDSPEQAQKFAAQMIGHKLITKQTGAAGRACNAVMLAERRQPTHEYYVAILNDRGLGGPALVASRQGGMNIEDVARDDPSAILTVPIDFEQGLSHSAALEAAQKLGFESANQDKAADVFVKLFRLFKEKDATQIEINPLAEVEGGDVLCMDAKLGFDENAEFRQKDVFKLRDLTQEDPAEVEAAKYGLNFIKLDGSIGCLVNGAGLAMATMDVLNLNGGKPANFLDVGGGATAEAVKNAFELILSDKGVKSIFVNIFGGIMRCDVIAEGIIMAAKELELKIPLIVRLQGTKEVEAKKLIKESGMKIFAFDGLDEAATAAVKAAA
ncbi:succinyl-CoA ligase [GDP-forming] subunit beta, hydrogenosomal [Microbotryum lychnidis-dioicae p1A1 Lamole]|uniref:Succinate--CoA ligase [ADP-forming] subunit beta, mitochondrial n=1 Tax=Microbotryum lychnidis-dioicae (strain p1A1 Lamole / MvSl-1064) TaxID=683840 RepID=U5H1G5_USTV1|nr:succinyl-CoA ligase [GDP-forming] subunit beta, hydrogenosomal [Microbotryum lychnidis-dioicae p1A1 Lamole]|eukprot:KDE08768.1 succinyl-CoA ligase [GDP-forming] subunit beta, hydrogenosomal [Microbotryum lychnidis-dioicae p1A1 Lamole]